MNKKIKLPTGYSICFEPWKSTESRDKKGKYLGVYFVSMGHVYKGKKKIGSCPGVFSDKDLLSATFPNLLRSLATNHITALSDLADCILKVPPYDDTEVTEKIKQEANNLEAFAESIPVKQIYGGWK